MDSTPPSRRSDSRLRTKIAARFVAQMAADSPESLLLDIPPSPKKPHLQLSSSPLQLSLRSPGQPAQKLQDLLLLPASPLRSSRHRRLEKVEPLEELVDLVGGSRRKCKSKSLAAGLLGCASPRNTRRVRRRAEEERDLGVGDDELKVRRKKPSRSRREKTVSSSSLPSPNPLPAESKETSEVEESFLDNARHLFTDLILWKNVAKSSLWFGCGSLFFISSSFTKSVNFSIVTAVSQLGLLILAISYLYKSFLQRKKVEGVRKEFKLNEDDLVRAAKYMLPVANATIGKTRELFSGEHAMTIKMAPILLFASEYGHLITLWRLFFVAFFTSFTIPKFYSSYSNQIDKQVEGLKCRVRETWAASSHKKVVAASAAAVFWNLSAVKTRLFAAFMSVVLLRYYRQQVGAAIEQSEDEAEQKQPMDVDGQGSEGGPRAMESEGGPRAMESEGGPRAMESEKRPCDSGKQLIILD